MKKQLILILILTISISGFAQTGITATIPYQGFGETQAHLGQAEYDIFMDTTTGIFDKPIILVDGFDPTDTRDITGMYDLLSFNSSNIADQLRSEGFDFVLLNFPVYTRASDAVEVDGGSDFIQRNAMILSELINTVNTQKVGSEELVIIGPSMGGLISRYALKYMEDNSMAHETRLFISWDAPHQGANIPIEMQYLMNYFAEVNGGDADLQAMVAGTLGSPASKQMLVDHYEAHLQAGSTFEQDQSDLLPIGAANFRDAFQTELDALGFPQQTRNISVSNGSGNSTMIGTPGMEILNYTFPVPNIPSSTMEIILHFTPAANQTIEVTKSTLDVPIFPDVVYTASAQSPSYTDGLDSAPGGKYDIQSFTAGAQGNQQLTDLLNALQQSDFCFIPTISSLAIDNENNWYATPDIPATHNSPFDAWYIPSVNEDHVTPTQANVDFILPEIRNDNAGVSDELLSGKYQLKSNLVDNELIILLDSKYQYGKTEILVYNISGQQLLNKIVYNASNEIRLPIQLTNGMYFMKIGNNESYFDLKFIVNK